MKKQQKSILVLAIITAFAATALLFPGLIGAGSLEPPATPDDAGSAMYTLEDIYNRLNDNTTATKRSGAFTEPSTEPGSTGHTLDQIYDLALPTRVAKTGQAHSYATGDDGDWQKGVEWPNPRFTDNGDGTVTDNLTGLIWLKDANSGGYIIWADALAFCNSLADDGTTLTDGSVAGDWRLPNVKELESLIDFGNYPALPTGHPFGNVQRSYYWSSTACIFDPAHAWLVNLFDGLRFYDVKTKDQYHVWPVRGGN